MPLIKFADPAGKTITVYKMDNGRLTSAFDPEVLNNYSSFKLREDDVLICSYTKSGTHWMFDICRLLLRGDVNTSVDSIPKQRFMIEHTLQSELDKEPSPRVLNTHFYIDEFPTNFKEKKPKIIYIRRNPKDVAVSYYNHHRKLTSYYGYEGEFKDYLQLFVDGQVDNGSWFEYVKHWDHDIKTRKDLRIISLTYEDMKEDLVREVRKVSDFLGLKQNEELIQFVANHCLFSSMEKRNGDLLGRIDNVSVIYRKGEVGDWKNWFTPQQNEWFDKIYKNKMADSDLTFRYTL